MKAAFLDRDGVINEDLGYVGSIEDFKFKEGIFEFLRLLQNKDYKLFIVTNQSGIARGYYKEEEFLKLMEWLKKELQKEKIEIIDFEYCPHHPEITGECDCRKPKPGMILKLANKYNIDLSSSIMIGDKDSDIESCKRAGLKECIKVKNDLFEVIEKIKGLK
jgi:D-glycero-D-manno-heptose 1,7-bisphosphate phosphatase